MIPSLPTDSDLIADFGTFLRYLEGKPNLPLTGAGDLKGADLYALNERVRLKTPKTVTTRSRVADYPLLGFLFQIATASQLYVVQFGKANILSANAIRLDAYQSLTGEEKYVFLLETAWCYMDWATLDGDDRSGMGAGWFRENTDELLKNPVGTPASLFTQGGATAGNPQLIRVNWGVNTYVRAGHWFGWYDMDEMAQSLKRDRYVLDIERVTLTGWGKQCLTLLRRQRPFHVWNQHSFRYLDSEADAQADEPVDLNRFAEPFRTLLGEPDLLSLYPINPNPPTGTYQLRVELPAHKVVRTLAMPAKQTLDALHLLIQQAVKFDNDHLYGFYLNPRNPYNGKQYFDPRTMPGWADGYPAAETTLASLNLYVGQRLLYIFDFGDSWTFFITVTRHLPDDKSEKAMILERIGKAPEQYG